MKVLVTGAGGFLGSSVVPGLIAAGHDVVATDVRVPEGAVVGTPAEPVWERMDVTDAAGVDAVMARHRPDAVVHLATIVTPGRDSNRELERAVDVGGTRHVLDACAAHGVRRLVVTSSGAAYGYHADNPVPLREDDPLRGNVEFAYSDHKRQVEEMLAAERIANPGLEQVILRIGTILGERVDNQITRLWEGPALLRIAGAESPFVFVWDEDVTAVVVAAVGGEAVGAFNVAGAGTVAVREIARRLGKPAVPVPEAVLKGVLLLGRRLGVTPYGPEQTRFLAHRPVLDASRLAELGVPVTPSREVFERFCAARGW